MFHKLSRALKNRKGFTLVELMAVVVIIGILAGIAIPVYKNVQTKAAQKAHDANVSVLTNAATMAVTENGLPTSKITWQGSTDEGTPPYLWASYVQAWPKVPEGLGPNIAGDDYKVEIDTNGTITVTPAAGTYQ